MKIASRSIGNSFTPLVIAEMGINHGGSLKEAKKIANAAITAGAEVIKHQTHIIDDEMSKTAKTTENCPNMQKPPKFYQKLQKRALRTPRSNQKQ